MSEEATTNQPPTSNKSGSFDASARATNANRHYPEDARSELQRIVPHSEHCFSIVDRVEPRLGVLARIYIEATGSVDGCSSCGDPADDYLIVNGAEAMPGVPSLRLCRDCVGIRSGNGEIFAPLGD